MIYDGGPLDGQAVAGTGRSIYRDADGHPVPAATGGCAGGSPARLVSTLSTGPGQPVLTSGATGTTARRCPHVEPDVHHVRPAS